MAFIFQPERDPRRDQMAAEFRVGDKVKCRNMVMPAEIISGPHKSPGHARYLIRKADGNVSLVPVTDLERIVPRLDKVAGTLAMTLYGLPFNSLDLRGQMRVSLAATRVLQIADDTRGER